jgi:hypothetical protein
MTNMILSAKPSKIEVFAKRVSTVPANGFEPLVSAVDYEIQTHENSYSVLFYGLTKNVNLALLYTWIPKGYRCAGVAIADDLLTVNIQSL